MSKFLREIATLSFTVTCQAMQELRFQVREDSLRMTAIFRPFFYPLPPSEHKMTSLLLNTVTSMLLIVTALGRPPPPP